MGKNLKGELLGKGVTQLPTGKYMARKSIKGKRSGRTFNTAQEAYMWLGKCEKKKYSDFVFSDRMTLDEWYDYWYENIKVPSTKYGTSFSYKSVYKNRIKNSLGHRKMMDIRPANIQSLVNEQLLKYKTKTIKQTVLVLKLLFDSAVDNEIIDHSPMKKITINKKDYTEKRVFTSKEQKRFEDYALTHGFAYSEECLLILQTGLRTGELLGLKWEDVDFQERKITVKRSMCFIHEESRYIETTPKTDAGFRMIPLTEKAYSILKGRKVTRMDYIFLDPDRTTKVCMNKSLTWTCKKLGMESISPHGLRHTFATRCIEAGMRPKTLQKIMGHSSIGITMNLYVHVTDDSIFEEMKKIEDVM